MNFSSIFGLLMGGGVMYFALSTTGGGLSFFVDMHGILIVVGGTLAATSISFSLRNILLLLKVFFLNFLGKKRVDFESTIHDILDLHKKRSIGNGLNDAVASLKHPFLREAVSLLASGVLNEGDLRSTLEQRVKTIENQYTNEANMFRVIGRFPPAFGLLATTLGMISLLQKIGQPDSQKLIGPAMSIGLIGTLYGIALANLVFIPIAENLTERTHEEVALRKMIVEGILLLKVEANPITLRELLNSYLVARKRPEKRN